MYRPWHHKHKCTTIYVVHYSYMKQLTKQTLHTLFGFLSSLLVLFGVVSLTSPYNLTSPLLIIPSLLIGMSCYFLIRMVQLVMFSERSRITPAAISIYLVLLLLLASLQQLSWRDVLLAGLFVWLFVFYFKRFKN